MSQQDHRSQRGRRPSDILRATASKRRHAVIQALEQRLLLSGTNLLVNGDFESEPNISAGVDGHGVNGHQEDGTLDRGFSLLTGSQIPGWTIASGHGVTVHIKSANEYPVLGGAFGVNVDAEGLGGANADLFQDFNTTNGQNYTLAFDWASWFSPGSSSLSVTLVDTVTQKSLFNGSYAFGGANHESANFAGAGNPVRLEIRESPESGTNDNDFNVDNFSVTPSAGHLLIAPQPTDTLAAAKLTPVGVAFVDDNGAVTDSTDTITVALSGTGNGKLSGTKSVAAVAGTATFSDLSVNLPGTYTLTFSDTTGDTIESVAFKVTAKAVFLSSPKDGDADAKLAPPVRVAVKDANDNIITGDSLTNVLIALTGITTDSPLGGSNEAQANKGIATFSNLTISKGGTYTLTAEPLNDDGSSGISGNSSQFKIRGAHLKFSKQPRDGDVNTPFDFAVAVLNSKNKVDKTFRGMIHVDITKIGGGDYGAIIPTSVSVIGGYATFIGSNAVSIDKPGSYTLTASSTNPDDQVGPATSNEFKLAGLHLKFSQQPKDTDTKAPINFAVAVLNAKNKVDKNYAGFVDIAVQSTGTADSHFTSPGPVAVVGGYATFAGSTAFTIGRAGTYSFAANTSSNAGGDTDENVASATSRDFKISGLHLKFSQKPKDVDTKAPINFAVAVLNSKNKPAKTYTGFIAVSVNGTNLDPNKIHTPMSVAVVGGYATFAGSTACTIDKAGKYSVTAMTSDAGGAHSPDDDVEALTSDDFKVTGVHLKFSKQPKDVDTQVPIEFAVAVLNSKDKPAKTFTGFISVSAQGDATNFTATNPGPVAVVGGYATFAGSTAFAIDKAGKYDLIANTSDSGGGSTQDDVEQIASDDFKVNGVHLKFSKPPKDADVNAPIDFAVAVLNSKDKPAKNYNGFIHTMVLRNDGGDFGTESPAAVPVVNGYASFTGSTAIKIKNSGTYSITADTSDDGGADPGDNVDEIKSGDVKITGLHLDFVRPLKDGDVNVPINFNLAVRNSKDKIDRTYNGFAAVDIQGGPPGFGFTAPSAVPIVNGFATFADTDAVSISTPGDYSFVARVADRAGGATDDQVDNATSNTFKINPLHLKFAKPLKDGDVGVPVDFAVSVLNSKNKVVPSFEGFIALNINGADDGFSLPTSVAVTGGTALFSGDVIIDKPGSYSITARATNETATETKDEVETATSNNFKINPLHLQFAPSPVDTDVDAPISFTVDVLTARNKVVTDFTGFVAVDINGGSGNGFIKPSAIAVAGGHAVFSGTDAVTISSPGSYTLTARASDETGAGSDNAVNPGTSRGFRVNPLHLSFSTPPSDAAVDGPVSFVVDVLNSKNKPATLFNGFVAVDINGASGNTGFTKPSAVAVVGGHAAFTAENSVTIASPGTYSFQARASDATGANSGDEVVTATSRGFKVTSPTGRRIADVIADNSPVIAR